MRAGSMYRRRARANDLRISVRGDDHEDSGSDSDPDGEPDSPDSPSPTSTGFPDGASSTTTLPPSSTAALPSSTDSGTTATAGLPAAQTTNSATAGSASSPDALPQTNDAAQAEASDGGTDTPGLSKKGAIAFGTIGGVVIVAALIFLIWKLTRRRRNARRRGSEGGGGGLSSIKPTAFWRVGEPPQEQQRGVSGFGPPGKTQSKIMDDLMAAAYAAEDGSASQYGGSINEKLQQQQYYDTHANAARASQPFSMKSSNSLYLDQLKSGFYKGPRADGLAVPSNARMPPRPAPSVAGQTEVSATTESTWRTWGWSQPKKQPKENWVDRCIRFGGLK
ncbi:hypothetical protein GGR52DRAFT_53396 [Hypoxylon sp. FL1284]|nr:hypothetical protein GGR52DRAFT_53396 [Hypoxylon sp. FL1284]